MNAGCSAEHMGGVLLAVELLLRGGAGQHRSPLRSLAACHDACTGCELLLSHLITRMVRQVPHAHRLLALRHAL